MMALEKISAAGDGSQMENVPSNNDEPITKSTCFRKLPVEIRLVIWRFTFPPPRSFNLNFTHGYQNSIWSIDPVMARKEYDMTLSATLPVTLSINKESRVETLKQFIVRPLEKLHAGGLSNRHRGLPLCLDTSRDYIHVNREWIMRNHTNGATYKILLGMKKRHPKLVSAIKTIDIRQYCEVKNGLDPHQYFCGAFRVLSGLTHVYLTKCRSMEQRVTYGRWVEPGWNQADVRGIEEAREYIAKVLALSKENFLSGKAPEVVIREWQCLPDVDMTKTLE
ncbi:hypothetical protein N431DRAFT_411342 [Stipitochalara longipes BDJ]|nr:hypothetical protein N431DRAFT_411342 [Stipitochalara longipes BDJ]